MNEFRALLIGINKYKQSPLNGCINDVLIMRDILIKKYGVPESNIKVLLDEEVTKENFLKAFESLVYNDSPYKHFHYSGHGAQMPNSIVGSDREDDGMDEVICPYDFDWYKNTYIVDDTIDLILNHLDPKHHLSMVFDCCHSGTMHRSLYETIPRSLEIPLDILMKSNTKKDYDLNTMFNLNKRRKNKVSGLKSRISTNHNVTIITGCKENQTSSDVRFPDRYQGALSFMLEATLLENPNIGFRELRDKCEEKLISYGFLQTPQLICREKNQDRPFIKMSD